MAESISKILDQGKESGSTLECAVCLQICIHPAQLPCGHIFCFLCVKGIANQSKRCAMCRQEIPRDFLEHPKLLEQPDAKETLEEFEGGYQWFYEGRNGWWKYDERSNEDIEAAYKLNLQVVEILICGELYVIDLVQMLQYPKSHRSRVRFIKRDKNNIPIKGWWQYDERTSRELESFYKAGERTCELLIAGFLYVADFDSMVQRRRNDPARKRRIKRDLSSIPKKGIAGIKLPDDQTTSTERSESPSSNSVCPTPPVTPADMPQTPVERIPGEDTVLDHESLQSTIEQMQSLTLRSNETTTDDSDNEQSSRNMYIFPRRYHSSHRTSH